jgi:hypothetical protein
VNGSATRRPFAIVCVCFNLDWHIVLIFQEFLFDQER